MNFIYQVDFVPTTGGRVVHCLAQISNIINTVIGRAINLDKIGAGAGGDLFTADTLAAGFGGGAFGAVQRPSERARSGGLANASSSAEQESVVNPTTLNGVAQRARDVPLPDHFVERGGTVLSGDREVRHDTCRQLG